MAYANTIDYLKNALNSYSADEEKLSKLYKQAAKNAEDSYAYAMKELEDQYSNDRNAAYADAARSDRNTGILLAERGLGFSGEAAQAKLNSNIALSGRLGALASEKQKNERQLLLDLSNQKSNLSIDEAEKLRDMIESKNGLVSNIAGMELDFETNQAKLAADAEKLKAEKEMHNASIEADKQMHRESIKADRDMLEAELNAKYNAALESDKSESGGNNNSGGDKNSVGSTSSENGESGGYVPSVTSKELAKQLVGSATDDGRIDSIHDRYNVNRYLLELTENYNIDEEYMNELIFLLKSFGYEEVSLGKMRREVISYEAYDHYGDTYDSVYNREIKNGRDEIEADRNAKIAASKAKLDFAYERCANLTEFRVCCKEMGYSEPVINKYIEEHKNENETSRTDVAYGGITNSSQ